MKKTIIILLFSAIAFTSLQIACSKSEAQTSPTTGFTPLNKLVFTKSLGNDVPREIWTCNYDGSNATKVNLPSTLFLKENPVAVLSPDGKKIFFSASTTPANLPGGYNNSTFSNLLDLYSCNLDGTSLTKIVDRGTGISSIEFAAAY
jgi:hypothetical protein